MQIIHLFCHLWYPIDFCLNTEGVNLFMPSVYVLLLTDITYGFTVSSVEDHLRAPSQIYF